MNNKIRGFLKAILWFLEGVIVGFGAIMPGISGGTLCVAFGMYLPLIGLFSKPIYNLKQYGKMLVIFVLGGIFGFVGLSGAAAWLMEKDSVLVTCLFIGLILGTFPQLWKDAGTQGRNKKSFIGMILGFIIMLALMTALQINAQFKIEEGIFGYTICGVLWGFSFIVPGLSSSTLLLFFDLYQPMLDGISTFDMGVIIPLGIGMLVCVLALSKVVNKAYEKYYSVLSHTIIGIVTATVVMIIPNLNVGITEHISRIIIVVIGGIMSYILTEICEKIKK